MIDLQSNELKPDDDDRLSGNRGKSMHKSGDSRRYMMIILGVVVLALLIILIISMLGSSNNIKTPNTKKPTPTSSSSGESQPRPQHPNEIHIPLISDTPTQSDLTLPENQKRIEIPGEIVDSLTELEHSETTSTEVTPSSTATEQQENTTIITEPNKTEKNQQTVKNKGTIVASGSLSTLKALPAGNVTIQLSAASRSESLAAFAKNHALTNYWIYETQRNGNPWYVLIMGNYPNSLAAHKAIAELPESIRSNKPWVKTIRQVHKEINQN